MTWQVLIRYFSSSHFIVGWSWDIYNAKCNFIGWIDSFPLVTHELGKTWKFWYILRDLLYNKLSHVIGKGQILLIPLVNFWILILISVHHVPSCKRIDFSFKKKIYFPFWIREIFEAFHSWMLSFLFCVYFSTPNCSISTIHSGRFMFFWKSSTSRIVLVKGKCILLGSISISLGSISISLVIVISFLV